MEDDWKEVCDRAKNGTLTSADFQTLASAIQSGQLTWATGRQSVGIGGSADKAIILTGSNNLVFVLQGSDAVAFQNLIRKTDLAKVSSQSQIPQNAPESSKGNDTVGIAAAEGNQTPVSCPSSQTVQQSGKFGVNIGQAQGIHVGDIYQTDPATIKLLIQEELRVHQRKYGDSIGLGLYALAELMHYPEVRVAVITFRVDFQAARQQIEIIATYKELHDLLHKLEIYCYTGIVQQAKCFYKPDDEAALDTLVDHELTLQTILIEVQNVAARKIIATSELGWLSDLESVQDELHIALEALDTRRLQRTIWMLNHILAIQPFRINANLNIAARALRLPALVNAMNAIWDRLIQLELNHEKIQQFQRGVKDLSELNQRLTALVSEHNYWQELDLELRRIEVTLNQDFFELEMSWPDLKKKAEILFEPSEDQWIVAFQQDSYNLDEALDSQNPTKIIRYFRRCRRRASERFYQVDVTLKRLCEELREVGEPLAFVLRMIE